MSSINSTNDNKYTYKIVFDQDKDAWNWLDAINWIEHGVNWSKDIPKDLLIKVKGKSETQTFAIIKSFLKQKYIDDKDKIDSFIKFVNDRYDQDFQNACEKIEEATGKPLYRNDFTDYITTYPMGPYNYEQGYTLDYIGWTNPIMGFMHELLHLQLTHYWRLNSESNVSKLPENQFEWLKESLTVIIDEDFLPIAECVDKGYKIHKAYRDELHKFWLVDHDFNQLINYAIELLPDYFKKI